MIAQKRDANEAKIVRALRGAGFGWISMDKSAGFDGLIISRLTGVHIVEIKNPATRWCLMPNEKKRQAQVEAVGGVYHVVFWPETALNLARGPGTGFPSYDYNYTDNVSPMGHVSSTNENQ